MSSHTITKHANCVVLEFEFPVGESDARQAVLFWRAADGTERQYAELAAGSRGEIVHTQSTFAGDKWVVRGPDAAVCLEYTAADAEVQRVVIRGVRAGSSSAAAGSSSAAAAATSQPAEHDGAADRAADEEEEERQLQLALKLSRELAEGEAARGKEQRESAPSPMCSGAPLGRADVPASGAALPAQPTPGALQSARPLPLSDALQLSRQLAEQHATTRRAGSKLASGAAVPCARLQLRFPELDGSQLQLELRATDTLQAALDSAVRHCVEQRAAPGGAADGTAGASELRLVCRAPAIALTLRRSGLVVDASPADAATATASSLGLLPSAVLFVTTAAPAASS